MIGHTSTVTGCSTLTPRPAGPHSLAFVHLHCSPRPLLLRVVVPRVLLLAWWLRRPPSFGLFGPSRAALLALLRKCMFRSYFIA